MAMGLVSGSSLANHSNSGSFLVVHTLLRKNGGQQGFWEGEGHVASPSDLSQILPVGGGLLALHSLLDSPVVKQLTQTVTTGPGQGGGCSQRVAPNGGGSGLLPWLGWLRRSVVPVPGTAEAG